MSQGRSKAVSSSPFWVHRKPNQSRYAENVATSVNFSERVDQIGILIRDRVDCDDTLRNSQAPDP